MARTALRICIIGFFFLAGTKVADAIRIDNTQCTVLDSSDSVDDFLSLRRDIEQGFNREISRLCTESIRFNTSSDYHILAEDTYRIDMPTDTDANGDGWGLKISGYGAKVVIDGALLDHDQCVFEVWNDDVQFTNMTIRVWDKDYAICNHGHGNDFSSVTIIETKPQNQLYQGNSLTQTHRFLP